MDSPILVTGRVEWKPTGQFFQGSGAGPSLCVICDQPISEEGMEEYQSLGPGEAPAVFSVRRHLVEHELFPINRLGSSPGGKPKA